MPRRIRPFAKFIEKFLKRVFTKQKSYDKIESIEKGVSMTRKELLDFEMSKFDEPENAEAKLYLGYITTYAVRAIFKTVINHLKAKETGKDVIPNVLGSWFRNKETLGDRLGNLTPIDPKKSEIYDFLSSYETACKRFLTVYDATYDKVCSPENREEYYTVNLLKALTDNLAESNLGKITNDDLVKAGYIDLRIPFLLSFSDKTSKEFTKNSYTENMLKYYESFESSLAKYNAKLVNNNRKKQ